jgi:hypothetical protein
LQAATVFRPPSIGRPILFPSAGLIRRNGQIVSAGAEACARDLGKKQQWDEWTRGCSELEFFQMAKVGLELGKAHCDRYSQ